MALKAVLESVDDLSDEIKGHYVEKDGKFVLDVEATDGYALEDVSGLTKALETERGQRKTYEKEVRDLKAKIEAYGDADPDKVQEALKTAKELAEGKLENETQAKWEARERQLIEQHEKQVADLQKQVQSYRGRIIHLGVDAEVEKALDQLVQDGHELHAGARSILLDHARKQVQAEIADDGALKVSVVDENGNPRIKDAQGNEMGIPDLVGKLPETMPFAFKASGAQGSGSSQNPGGGTPPASTKKRSEMGPADKGRFIREHGLDAYNKLPE